MRSLNIMAGPRAAATIARQGLRGEDFGWLAGASGGPKWFVLYGLDRYLAGEFFATRSTPLRMIGSSAGAWRLACYAHPQPVSALDTIARHYATQTYSEAPDRHEISREARGMVDAMLASGDATDAAQHIAANSQRRLYVIADRARHLLRSEGRVTLNAGLLLAALSNMAGRSALQWFFERTIFHNDLDDGNRCLPLTDLPTRFLPLRADNVRDALMASGSIPFVMEAVQNVSGAGNAVFRDGGITDYHLDLPWNRQQDLVLYPHFYNSVVPGWFDKFAPWRKADARHFDNVVLVAPSRDFVNSLPFAKIPDRNDFRRMPEQQRIDYWLQVQERSRELGDAFRELVALGPEVSAHIQPFTATRRRHV